MSPSWAERWRVGLAPDGAEVLRRTLPGRALAPPQRVTCRPLPGQSAWTAALSALATALDEAGAKGSPWGSGVGVVLSNHFVRYVVLPWQPELNSARELEALARLRFQAVYGDVAAAWTVRCSEGGWGQASVACAVDSELLASLQVVLGERGLRLASLQPLLMAAFNDLRRKLAGDAALAIVEPGRLCLGLLQRGAFDAVVSRRTPTDAAPVAEQELATLRPIVDGTTLDLLRIGESAPWSGLESVRANEWATRPLSACGMA